MSLRNMAVVTALVVGLWCENLIYPAALLVREAHDDIVVVEHTTSGHLFIVEDADGWEVGDLAVGIMGTNGTEEMEDDEVIIMGPSGYKVKDLTKESDYHD